MLAGLLLQLSTCPCPAYPTLRPLLAAELSVAMREHLAAASGAAAVAEAEHGSIPGGGEPSRTAGAAGPAPPSPRAPLSPMPSPSPVQLASHARWRQEVEDALEAAVREEQALQAQQAAGSGASGATAGGSASGSAGASASAVRVAEHIAERQREQAQALLLRWVEQQEGGAFEAIDKTKETLLALKVIVCRQSRHWVQTVVWPVAVCSVHRLHRGAPREFCLAPLAVLHAAAPASTPCAPAAGRRSQAAAEALCVPRAACRGPGGVAHVHPQPRPLHAGKNCLRGG